MEVIFRDLLPGDLEPIRSLLEATAVFRTEEIEVAMELLGHPFKNPGQDDYYFLVAESDGNVTGYACWGATPGTRGTWDLYWIATAPEVQGKGTGKKLMAAAETDMARRGGRLCIVETSGLASYEKTRQFYLHNGYVLAARISDYYAPGDDLCIFTKRLRAL